MENYHWLTTIFAKVRDRLFGVKVHGIANSDILDKGIRVRDTCKWYGKRYWVVSIKPSKTILDAQSSIYSDLVLKPLFFP